MSETVIGVDGCPGGWIAVIWKGTETTVKRCSHFAEVLKLRTEVNAAVVAVDMPMGLPKQHGRAAERSARLVLGKRRSSVFSTPSREAFQAGTWQEACQINLRNSVPPRKLSQQSFALFPKIGEIDDLLSPTLQVRVQEVHPEVSFCEMNDRQPLKFAKKKKSGEDERLGLLRGNGFPFIDLNREHNLFKKSDVARDDIIDAYACAWSARRIHLGQAASYPEREELDALGLIMRIMA